jgi:hypothetical protein
MRGGWVLLGLPLLPFAGCGLAAPSDPEPAVCGPNAEVEIRLVEEIGGSRLAETDRCQNPTSITVLDGLDIYRQRRAIAHELCHAAGLVEHEDDPECYLYETIIPITPDEPCPHELARMQAAGGEFRVRIVSPELAYATGWAVEFWNEALGRTAFTVE